MWWFVTEVIREFSDIVSAFGPTRFFVLTTVFFTMLFSVGFASTAYFEGWLEENRLEPQTVQLYYYDPNEDVDEHGKRLCSEQGLMPVERRMYGTDVVEETIRALLAGELLQPEADAGLTTEFPLDKFQLVESVAQSGTLTLTFLDPREEFMGDECRARLLRMQVERTARQFESIEEVQFNEETILGLRGL